MFNGESITIKLILKLEKDQKNMTLFRAACCLSSTQSFVIPSKFSSQEIVPKGVQRFLQTIVHIGLCRHVGIFISTVECICCKIKNAISMNHCSVFADAHPLDSFPVCFGLASNLSLHKQQYKNPPQQL